jgi:hypothetical protein
VVLWCKVEDFMARFVRVCAMEIHDHVLSIHKFCSGKPAELVIGVLIAQPVHMIN